MAVCITTLFRPLGLDSSNLQGEIRGFVNLDLEFLFKTRQKNPIAWGTYQPHNAYQELPSVLKAIIQPQTRLESLQLTANAVYHPSFAVAPTKVNDPTSMVTLPLLRQAFGVSWNPTYSELNAWEQECKKRWNEHPVRVSIGLLCFVNLTLGRYSLMGQFWPSRKILSSRRLMFSLTTLPSSLRNIFALEYHAVRYSVGNTRYDCRSCDAPASEIHWQFEGQGLW